MITEYAELLAEKLSFDPSLSRRVRREVEDHLWEAMASSAAGSARATAEQAIARFGDPQALAAEFATTRLAQETQRATAAAILLVGATLVAMKARVAWYGFAQWQLDTELRALGTSIGIVDGYAFWLAVVLTVSSWVYLIAKRVPDSHAALCRQLRHVVCLNSVCATALSVSVTCDAALTALRLLGKELSVASLVPLSSMLAEMVLAGILLFKICKLIVRATRTSGLVEA
jgi:hypothetical protein